KGALASNLLECSCVRTRCLCGQISTTPRIEAEINELLLAPSTVASRSVPATSYKAANRLPISSGHRWMMRFEISCFVTVVSWRNPKQRSAQTAIGCAVLALLAQSADRAVADIVR